MDREDYTNFFLYFSFGRLRAEKGKEQRAGGSGRTTTSEPPIDVEREGVVAFLTGAPGCCVLRRRAGAAGPGPEPGPGRGGPEQEEEEAAAPMLGIRTAWAVGSGKPGLSVAQEQRA